METVDSGNGSEVQNGVVIPQQTIEDSTNKKKKAKKTLAQLPVYRDASNQTRKRNTDRRNNFELWKRR